MFLRMKVLVSLSARVTFEASDWDQYEHDRDELIERLEKLGLKVEVEEEDEDDSDDPDYE